MFARWKKVFKNFPQLINFSAATFLARDKGFASTRTTASSRVGSPLITKESAMKRKKVVWAFQLGWNYNVCGRGDSLEGVDFDRNLSLMFFMCSIWFLWFNMWLKVSRKVYNISIIIVINGYLNLCNFISEKQRAAYCIMHARWIEFKLIIGLNHSWTSPLCNLQQRISIHRTQKTPPKNDEFWMRKCEFLRRRLLRLLQKRYDKNWISSRWQLDIGRIFFPFELFSSKMQNIITTHYFEFCKIVILGRSVDWTSLQNAKLNLSILIFTIVRKSLWKTDDE